MEVDNRHRCQVCNRRFTRSYNLKKHIQIKHDKVSLSFSCYLCRKNFRKQDKYLRHIDNHKEGLSFVLYNKPLIKQFRFFASIFKIIFHLMIF